MNVTEALLTFYDAHSREDISRDTLDEVLPMLNELRDDRENVEVLAVITGDMITMESESLVSLDDVIMEDTLVSDVNFKKKLGTCTIYLYTNDNFDNTNHPHVHIVSNDSKIHDVCVRLDCALYFPHGDHDGKFNNQQAKIFDSVMRKVVDDNLTVWKRAVKIYNRYRVPKITRKNQPNYTLLNELKNEDDCKEKDKDD